MNRRSDYGTMVERNNRTREKDRTPAPSIRHWVTDSNGRLAGLLVEWRQVAGEWRGRVVHPVLEDGAWVVEEWLPTGVLDPT